MRNLFFIFIFLGFTRTGLAQESNQLADYPGKWIYTNENLSNEWYAERFYSMSPAELAKYHSTTEQFLAFFQKQNIVKNPKGINLTAKSRAMYDNYDHEKYPVSSSEIIKARLFIQFCPLVSQENKIISFCDEVPYIDIIANSALSTYESGMNIDFLDNKDVCKKMLEMFYLPDTLIDLGNGVVAYNCYYDNRVIIARNNRPCWLNITTKEFINRTMAYYNASLKEGKINQMVMDALKSEIAKVPMSNMNKPAYVSNNNTESPLLGITSNVDIDARAVCIFNPSYFDNQLKRSDIQLITIKFPGNLDDETQETEISRIRVLEFIKKMNGSELKTLLDVK